MESSDYFILYVALFLLLAALLVGALIILALHLENKKGKKPVNALKSSSQNGNDNPVGNRYQDKRVAVSALRADIDLALYTLELEGKTSVAQCQMVVQQVYQGWLKKHMGLFTGAQGKVIVTGKKAGLWTYRLPRDLENLVAGIAG
jgi:hypothetical protein